MLMDLSGIILHFDCDNKIKVAASLILIIFFILFFFLENKYILFLFEYFLKSIAIFTHEIHRSIVAS